jgi:lipid-binding SYLF domain-containing protein
MNMSRKFILPLFLMFMVPLASMGLAGNAHAATAEDLQKDAEQALDRLLRINPVAEQLAGSAKATLIFPNIVKAGLVFGGSYGEGVLKVGSRIEGYYNSVSGSWGLQAGAQSYGYVVFLMTDAAVNYLRETNGGSSASGRRWCWSTREWPRTCPRPRSRTMRMPSSSTSRG